MGRVQDEVIQLRRIDFVDIFVRRETAEGFETACKIVWRHETCERHAEKNFDCHEDSVSKSRL